MSFMKQVFAYLVMPFEHARGAQVVEPVVSDISKSDIGQKLVRDQAHPNGHFNEDHRNKKFDDLNGNGKRFTNCDFSYSVFHRGYFHKAKFENCNFVGCRFYDCNFREARFNSCDFRYTTFQCTLLPAQEIIPNLPPQPNLRRDVLQQLKVNALQVGDVEGARKFTDQEIQATYDHLMRALKGSESYYSEKYPTTIDKAIVALGIVRHGLSGFFWGHGERPGRLIYSLFIIITVASFLNAIAIGTLEGFSFARYTFLSLQRSIDIFLDVKTDIGVHGFAIVDYILVVMRYVYIGLFIAVLEKYISFR